jgi:hypothetical protein
MFYYKIPYDIFNEKIMPFTYNSQNLNLLTDIRHYYESKQTLYNRYSIHDINEFIIDYIYEYVNETNNELFGNVVCSRLYLHFNQKMKIASLNFNHIWGLMTSVERNRFFDYIEFRFNMIGDDIIDDNDIVTQNNESDYDYFDYIDYIDNMD